jgi:hypothetical protein
VRLRRPLWYAPGMSDQPREVLGLTLAGRIAVAAQCAVAAGFVVVGLASALAAQGWTDLALVTIALLVVVYLVGVVVSVFVARRMQLAIVQVVVIVVVPAVALLAALSAFRAARV